MDACESFSFTTAGQCYLWTDIIGGVSQLCNTCVVPGYGPSSSECTSFSCSSCTDVIAGTWERRVDRDCQISTEWSDWSLCTDWSDCGIGNQNRTSSVIQPQRGMGAACAPTIEFRQCNASSPGALSVATSSVPEVGEDLACFDEPVVGRYCQLNSFGSCSTMANRIGQEITLDYDGFCTETASRICLLPADAETVQQRQAACARACLAEPTCETANWKDATARCSLYTGAIGGGTNPGQLDSAAGYMSFRRMPTEDCNWTWSPWSACSDACESEWGSPQKQRTQIITQQPSCGGLACPAIITEFAACSIIRTFEDNSEAASSSSPPSPAPDSPATPISDSVATANVGQSAEHSESCNSGACLTLTVQLTLNKELSSVPPDTEARREFEAVFKADVAAAIEGVSTTQITIVSIRAGSLVVEFSISVEGSRTLMQSVTLSESLGCSLQVLACFLPQ